MEELYRTLFLLERKGMKGSEAYGTVLREIAKRKLQSTVLPTQWSDLLKLAQSPPKSKETNNENN